MGSYGRGKENVGIGGVLFASCRLVENVFLEGMARDGEDDDAVRDCIVLAPVLARGVGRNCRVYQLHRQQRRKNRK